MGPGRDFEIFFVKGWFALCTSLTAAFCVVTKKVMKDDSFFISPDAVAAVMCDMDMPMMTQYITACNI